MPSATYDRESILRRHSAAIDDLCESWEVDKHLFRSWMMLKARQPGCKSTGLDPSTGLPTIAFHPNRLLMRLSGEEDTGKWHLHFRVNWKAPTKGHEYRPKVSDKFTFLHTTGPMAQKKEWEALELSKKLFGAVSYDAVTVGWAAVPVSFWRELSYESAADMLSDAKYEIGQVRQAFFYSMIEYGPGFFESMSSTDVKSLAELVAIRHRDVESVERSLIAGYRASQSGLFRVPEGK